MQKNKIITNISSAALVYAILLVLNLVISNIVLRSYGSEMNGLVSSVNQIFSYVAMLEAGIGTATINAFYKPIADKNSADISDVFSTSVRYFRRASIGYLLCAVTAAFLWPLAVDTSISYWLIFFLILLQGVSNALSFCFTSTTTAYLLASGKNYVNTYFHTAITLFIYAAKIVVCWVGGSYLWISISLVLINIFKCFCYYLYRRLRCKDIVKLKYRTNSVLPQRNSLLIHEISGAVFSSTDIIIISIFCDLKAASIYAVYSMVVSACTGIIGQVFNSLTYVLGNAYSKKTRFVETVDRFNAVYIPAVFAIYTAVFLMLKPFISVYTQGITDVDYTDMYLPILFVLIQLLSACRIVDGAIVKIALHAKNTVGRSIIESGINLSLSLILINFIGIYGVLLGTIIALLYRSNDIILYTNKHILQRKAWKEYGLYLLNFALFFGFCILNDVTNITAISYFELFVKAIIVFVLVLVVFLVANSIYNFKTIAKLLKKES